MSPIRVAVLGIGGVGRTLTRILRSERHVDALLLVDRHPGRTQLLIQNDAAVRVETRALEVGRSADLSRVLRGWDAVVNTLPPPHNLEVMRACLNAGTHYLDLAAAGPRSAGGKPGIFEQLELHAEFKQIGLKALLGMGLDPGMSNVLARDAASGLDVVDQVRIRSGGTAHIPGYVVETFPLYSRESFLTDVLLPPSIWSDQALREREPMGEPEDYNFPGPVGVQRAFLVSHEEVKTLPRYLGKPVGRVDFKQAFNPELLQAVVSLHRLGALADDRWVHLGGTRVPFKRLFLEVLPEPSAIVQPIDGAKALSVEVEGTAAGTRRVVRRDIVMQHRETSRRASITAVVYLTAVAAGIGVLQLGSPRFSGPGVYPPEALDPKAVLSEWAARDLPLARSERVVPA